MVVAEKNPLDWNYAAGLMARISFNFDNFYYLAMYGS